MTQDEIIEMAREAGFEDFVRWSERYPHEVQRWIERMTAFAKLVAAKEQDRCCAIVFAQCESDNVAQRTVDAIRGKA